MFWYTWDMDQSFIDMSVDVKGYFSQRERWEKHPYIANFFDPDPDVEGKPELCPRVALFKALVNKDLKYRDKAVRSFLDILNHKLTDEFLAELLFKHWDKLYRSGNQHCQNYIAALSDFFRHRRYFLIKQAESYFNTQPFISCQVTSNKYPVVVDGYEKHGAYLGFHRPGDSLTIGLPGHSSSMEWIFNGTASRQPKEIFVVPAAEEQCRVKVVFAD
jgi:hypothetical protein